MSSALFYRLPHFSKYLLHCFNHPFRTLSSLPATVCYHFLLRYLNGTFDSLFFHLKLVYLSPIISILIRQRDFGSGAKDINKVQKAFDTVHKVFITLVFITLLTVLRNYGKY